MKTLSVLFAALILSVAVMAQTAPAAKQGETTKPVPSKEANPPAYCCPSCDYSQARMGTCPNHKTTELIQEGMFYCEHDHTTSAKAASCPKCGMEMKKMVKKTKVNKEGEHRPDDGHKH